MATIRFYIHPVVDAYSEDHWISFCPWPAGGGEWIPIRFVKLLQSVPSAYYGYQQWHWYAPGQESYPDNFFCYSSGNICDTVAEGSLWITQGTDLEDALTAENCNRFAAGTWRVTLHLVSGGAIPDTTYKITFRVYLLSDSVENLLFQWTTDTIGPTFDFPDVFDSPEQDAYDIDPGDRLVVKAHIEYVLDNGDAIKLRMGKTGPNEYYSYVEFPADEAPGKLELVNGWKIGEITINDNSFTAELRSRAQFLQQNIIELYTPQCRADLGDSRCGIDLDDSADTYKHKGAVTSVSEDRYKFKDTSVPSYAAGDVFTGGLVTWSTPQSADSWSGNNATFTMEVKKYDPSTQEFELFHPMPYDIEVDDEFTVTWGCDKSVSTCKDTFSNIANFRGEPYVPQYDKIRRGRV